MRQAKEDMPKNERIKPERISREDEEAEAAA